MTDLKQLERDCISIHSALHSSKYVILLDGEELPIRIAPNGCRYLSYKQITFIEQDKNKRSPYALRAQAGEKITWGIPLSGKWILIDNKGVQLPSTILTIANIIESINAQVSC